MLVNNRLHGFFADQLPIVKIWQNPCLGMKAIMRFTAIMARRLSLFDIAILMLGLGVTHAGIGEFSADSVIEPLASQILDAFAIRTSLPFWGYRPHCARVATALISPCGALKLTLPR